MFRVIEGGRKSSARRAGRRLSLTQDEQTTCWRCEKEIGVATSTVIEVTQAPRRSPKGKKRKGTKQWACAYCMTRGKLTILIR